MIYECNLSFKNDSEDFMCKKGDRFKILYFSFSKAWDEYVYILENINGGNDTNIGITQIVLDTCFEVVH